MTGGRYAAKNKNLRPEHTYFDKERMDVMEDRYIESEEEKKQRIEERANRKKFLWEIDGDNVDQVHEQTEEDIVLVHGYSHKEGPHKEWEGISRKMRGLIKLYEFNPKLVMNKRILENDFKNMQTPFVATYPTGSRKYRNKNVKLFGPDAPFAKIAGFVSENLEDKSMLLGSESMKMMISRAITNYKGAVVLFHESPETLLSYRGIAR